MEVLMYGWEFPPHISGGLGVACQGIVNALSEKNVQVTFVLPYASGEFPSIPNVNIVACNTLSNSGSRKFFLNPYVTSYRKIPGEVAQHINLNLLSEVHYYADIASQVASQVHHDIIHAHDWLTIIAGLKARERSKRPLIFQVHALEVDRSGDFMNQVIFDIEKQGLEEANHIVAVSQYTKNLIVERYGIPANKITVVHNGIKSQKPNKKVTQKKKKIVLFLGRITHQKGPYFFLEVARKVLSRRNDVEFIMAGQGDLMHSMIEHAANIGIGQQVHFTGFLNRDAVNNIYSQADVYVMPSVSEPFGLTCLEAMSHEVPVIISKQSGVSEALKHVLKADFWDVNEMASKILTMLQHRPLQSELQKNATAEVKAFSWEKTAEKLIRLYKQLISKTIFS
ncbi:MAG: glycosyltransferase family 4 protein [Gammaproteobacteria bacterium]|nr:glycosyltransferase family 4 protein [Gammaproteobacteria bacterium]